MNDEKTSALEPGVKLAVVIMAAGSSVGLHSRRPKALHEVGGKPLLGHVIAAAGQIVSPGDIYVVVGHQAERVRQAMADTGVRFVEQNDPRGTGHAIQCARTQIAGYDHVLVLSGDVPLIRPEHLAEVVHFHLDEHAAMTLVCAEPGLSRGHGRVLRETPASQSRDHSRLPETQDSTEVVSIVEPEMATPEHWALCEINMGLYVFKTAPLLAHLDKLADGASGGRLCLAGMAAILHSARDRVVAFRTDAPDELRGADTLAGLAALDAALRTTTANRLMAAGVAIFRPETCVIDPDVEVAADTVIEPFVQLLGRTRIGADCRIRSYSVIENCTLGNEVLIRQSCVLAGSTVAAGASIGPFAHLRPGCEIGEDVHIGNFVETKKVLLGKGVKAGHLTYLGDAVVGAGTNIGAGVITCNYDGVHKHQTHIGEGVFVGSDSTLEAPVEVKDGAYIGAGSCITKEVPAGALAVGRSRQITKEGWATSRRAQQKAKG